MVSSNHSLSSPLSPLKTYFVAKHVLSFLQPSSHCCPRCSRHRCAKRARGSRYVQQRRRVLLQPEIHREISLCPSILVGDSRIHSQDPADFTGILGSLLTAVVGATVPIGLTCNPITVIGVGGGGTCSVQTACCSNDDVVSSHHVSLHSPLRTDDIAPFFLLFHAEW